MRVDPRDHYAPSCAAAAAAAAADNLPARLDAARRQLRRDRSRLPAGRELPAAAAGHWPERLRAAVAQIQRPGLPPAGRLRAAVVRRPGLPPADLPPADLPPAEARPDFRQSAAARPDLPQTVAVAAAGEPRSPQEIVSKLDLIESPEGNL